MVLAMILGVVPAFVGAAPARAQQASATGSVEIRSGDGAGTGVIFDPVSATLSGIYLHGETGEAISLVRLALRRSGIVAQAGLTGEVVILSTGAYAVDLSLADVPPPVRPASQGGAGPLRSRAITAASSPDDQLLLAQFN